jgi:O-antigen/teichoic acid export membrane protein
MMLTVIAGVLTGALQGMQHLRIVAVIDALSKLALLGLVAAFLFQGLGARSVAVAYVLSDLIAIVWLLYAVKRRGGLSGSIRVASWKTLVTGGLPFFVWEAALLTYARVDVILLSILSTSAVLGWYYAAYRIISIPLFLPVILMTAIFPALSASARDPQRFNSFARQGVIVAAMTSIPMAIGLGVLADKVIELFGYPASFSNSVAPITLLSCSIPLVAINMIVAPALSALDKQRSWAILGVGAAILNPVVNLAAIPLTQSEFGNGAIGAGAVTTLTEVYLLAGGLILLPRGVLNRETFSGVLRCLLAGALMAAALWIVRDLSIFLLVPLGAVAYCFTLLLLRVVTLADLLRARSYIAARVEPAVTSP